MTNTNPAGDRRAQHVALFGFIFQVSASVLLLALAYWQNSHLGSTLARFVMVGIPIWFVLYLVLSQIRRVGLESLETQELKRSQASGKSQALFEVESEALLLEQARLKWMIRWLLPSCTILISLLLLLGHFVGWGWSLNEVFDSDVFHRTGAPTVMMWFMIGVGFVCFLCAKYVIALAQLPGWRLLRAGAVFLAGAALSAVVVSLALMVTEAFPWAEPVAAYLIRVALVVLGVEMAVNFILDLYRPRLPNEFPRPSFDSRLLGLLSAPGGITKSIAEAVNYQFGFQVSSTWFYQLLQRWLFPIAVLSLAGVLLCTSVVVVDADERVIVERFGRIVDLEKAVLGPGVHFKWPYPVDIVHRAPEKRISELVIGEADQEDDEHGHGHEGAAVVWTEEHDFVAEMMLLVASPKLERMSAGVRFAPRRKSRSDVTESVAVNLLMVSVPIEYRIKDIYDYLYTYEDPEKLLENVAYQYLSDYAAGVDIDELIGPGRKDFNRELKRLLQARLDEMHVGIEIVFCGIRDAHPPAKAKVAEAFQEVVSASTNMASVIHAAKGEARRILTIIAGTETRALALDEAIRARDALPKNSPELPAAQRRVDVLITGDAQQGIAPISGDAAAIMADARANASEQTSRAAAKAFAFSAQVAGYDAAPVLYEHRKWLDSFQHLDDTRKYLIVGDRSNVIIEYETAKEAGLDQVLTEGVAEEHRRSNP